ncbi:HAD family hydrolase [Peterkaempfera griseoplana]|uniref:HAD family hydrolase n=1 Tax=Peterkaempfera griseoplana TaxID=66896 RepID=UPI0006E150BD|nr:HAD family hydrolase [Peterkaempfera griseoplana]
MSEAAAVLFDVDGTLVDTTCLHTVAWWEALRQYGHHVAMPQVQRSIGMGADQLLDHLLPDRDRAQDGELEAAHTSLYAQWWPVLRPLPGARDLLYACAERGLRVVLASSASQRELEVLLGVLDAREVIHAATTADDVAASKPAPDLVQVALEKAGCPGDRAVFVGDTVWDVRAAGRAGVPCVGVESGGFCAAELSGEGAVEVYSDTAELLAALDGSRLRGPGRG